MKRRTLLQLPLAAPLAAAPPAPRQTGFKLSVRVEGMFRKLTLPEQMRKVAEAGYQGFEFGDWTAQDGAAIAKLARELKIECACIVNRAQDPKQSISLTNPADRPAFLAATRASVEAARRFETTRIVTLAGKEVAGVARETQHRSVVEGLKAAHDIAAAARVTMILEPFNILVNHPGAYLYLMSEAFAIVREVGSPWLKILFDIYHVQVQEGNLVDTIRKNIAAIGHFHVADVPGRHEPGTGEINYGFVFQAIRDAGYRDFVGMEYGPSRDPMATLADVKRIWDHLRE
jgi:hydroxypyruvate isomerase